MKIKVSEATNIQLDWLVAKCEGFTSEYEPDVGDFWIERTNHTYTGLAPFGYLKDALRFSTDWSQGGPIIEKEKIGVDYYCLPQTEPVWIAGIAGTMSNREGPTPLIAAMRCLVASKLGDEVEVPNELS
jgi:hypothetical protein